MYISTQILDTIKSDGPITAAELIKRCTDGSKAQTSYVRVMLVRLADRGLIERESPVYRSKYRAVSNAAG